MDVSCWYVKTCHRVATWLDRLMYNMKWYVFAHICVVMYLLNLLDPCEQGKPARLQDPAIFIQIIQFSHSLLHGTFAIHLRVCIILDHIIIWVWIYSLFFCLSYLFLSKSFRWPHQLSFRCLIDELVSGPTSSSQPPRWIRGTFFQRMAQKKKTHTQIITDFQHGEKWRKQLVS